MQENMVTKKKARVITFKLLAMLAFLVLVLSVFAYITHEVIVEKEDIFDTKVIHFFQEYSNHNTRDIMEFFTFFGSTTFLLPAYFVIIVWMWQIKRKWQALHIIIISFGSFLLVKGLKLIFQRARPEATLIEKINSFSFPSGHTVSAIVFFSLLIYTVWKTNIMDRYKILITIFSAFIAIMVGVSRIMLGVHYPSDVMAGFALASAWVIISSWLLNTLNARRSGANESE